MRGAKEEGRGGDKKGGDKKAEDRRQKAEDRGQKTETSDRLMLIRWGLSWGRC
jgi:hypothetical protein